jgi:hypothetical protein
VKQASAVGKRLAESVGDNFDEPRSFAFPTVVRFRQVTRGLLAPREQISISEELVELLGKSSRFVKFRDDSDPRISRQNFSLTSSVGRNDRQASIEILNDLVRDREIAIDDERLFEREPDVVTPDQSWQLGRRNQRQKTHTIAKVFGQSAQQMRVVAAASLPKENDFARLTRQFPRS